MNSTISVHPTSEAIFSARFVSDLIKQHSVGFPMRLILFSFSGHDPSSTAAAVVVFVTVMGVAIVAMLIFILIRRKR